MSSSLTTKRTNTKSNCSNGHTFEVFFLNLHEILYLIPTYQTLPKPCTGRVNSIVNWLNDQETHLSHLASSSLKNHWITGLKYKAHFLWYSQFGRIDLAVLR